MKFRIDRDTLADAISWTSRSVPQRRPASAEILGGVLINASTDQMVELAAFDREVSAKVEAPAEVETPGTVLVSGRLLSDIAKLLPNKPVTFELDGAKVRLTCDKSKFTLLTMPVDEYPLLPQLPELSGKIDANELSRAVAQVVVAAERDENYPVLTTIRFEVTGDEITMLSTDRYRLAKRTLKWEPESPDVVGNLLIKAKTLNDITKTHAPEAAEIEFSLPPEDGARLVGISGSGRQATSQLVDGDYPPVQRLFPEETPITAVVATPALIDAVKRVSLVAERGAPITLSFSEGEVALSAGRGDDAQASESLPAELSGEDISVAFNPLFLLDGLGALGTDFVKFGMTHPTKPVEFTGQDSLEDNDDAVYRYLLVPIRVAV